MSKVDHIEQLDKFKALARELEADEDVAAWDDRLRKLAKVKPEPDEKQSGD